jgi:CHAD domain-containing protein
MEKPLRQLRKSLRQLPDGPAPDAVHRLRTRSRQVEAIAAALPPAGEKLTRRLLKSIKSVRKAAGRVRDMDVLAGLARTLPQELHGEAIACLAEHLESSRKKHAAELLETLDRHHKPAREHLKQYAGQIEKRKDSAEHMREMEDRVQATATRLTADLSRWPTLTARNLHAFRLKVKELRAVLQFLDNTDRALVDDLRRVKDKIGGWHDWLQLAKTAAEVLNAQQHRPLLMLIRQTCRQKLNEALASADAFRQHPLERLPKKPPASERRIPASAITGRRPPAA